MVAEHYIQSPNLECGVLQLMSQEDLPFSIRENCIRSMFHLFERLFAQEPLETSVQMWWDSLCYDWHCGNRSRAKGGEDQEPFRDLQAFWLEGLCHQPFREYARSRKDFPEKSEGSRPVCFVQRASSHARESAPASGARLRWPKRWICPCDRTCRDSGFCTCPSCPGR